MTTTAQTTTAVGHYTVSSTHQTREGHVSLVDNGVHFNKNFNCEYPSNTLVEITALAEPEDRIS